MTDKTPEERAIEYAEDNISIFDGDYENEIRERLILAYLGGYHSRDKEVKDLESRLAVAEEIHHD